MLELWLVSSSKSELIKSYNGSLKESDRAILEVKPRNDAVKDKEGFEKLRAVYKRHLKNQVDGGLY